MIVTDFFQALSAGKELANATTWKKAQVVVSKLSVFAGAAISISGAFGYAIPLTPEQIGILAGAVGVLVGLFNGTATVVSTARIGVPIRRNAVPDGRPDAELDGIGDRAIEEPDRGSNRMASRYPGPDDQVPYLKDIYRG
jgi:hypothetical protein